MSVLRSKKYKVGDKDKTGKLWFLGLNECTLIRVGLHISKNKSYYISCTFARKNEQSILLKTPINFTPFIEYVFNTDQANNISMAFCHIFKDKPDDMEQKDYLTHLARRLRTFEGQQLQTVVGYEKRAIKDAYGHIEQRVVAFNKTADVELYEQKMTYHNIDEKVEVPWDVIKHKMGFGELESND
jgi:hypothetical protein